MNYEDIAEKTTYAVSGGLVGYGWIGHHLNEIAILFGMLMGLLTFIISTIFKKSRNDREQDIADKEEKRRAELHKLQIDAIKANRMYMSQHEDDA